MSRLLAYRLEEGPARRIERIDGSILSPDEIRRRSVARISEPIIYDKTVPKSGGVNDHRLGVVDRKYRCGTCGHGVGRCQGHEGHIELPFPVFHVSHLDTILKVLRLVCFSCCRLLFDPHTTKHQTAISGNQAKNRLNALAQSAKTCRRCIHDDENCAQFWQPVYMKKGYVIECDWKGVIPKFSPEDSKELLQHPFTARDALEILRNISDDDCRTLGFDPKRSRPEWMIQTVVLVSSPVIRPTVAETSGARTRGQDDITKKLIDIVKAVKNVEKWYNTKGATSPPNTLLDGLGFHSTFDSPPPTPALLEELQLHVSTMVNNDVRGAKPSLHRSNQPTKSIYTRLKGKEGRVRNSLMGKRVDHNGRSVISPDAENDVDVLGVPHSFCQKGTQSCVVQLYNYDILQQCVRWGAQHRYGAVAVAGEDGSIIYLQHLSQQQRDSIVLDIGWTVWRYLRNGDDVLTNRQPSLHQNSFLAFRLQEMPGSTQRMNLANTPGYNADFDGDEMNLHLPITEMTRAEARELMAGKHHMITPQHKPIITPVQDGLVGIFLMTRKSVFFNRAEIMDLLMSIKHKVDGVSVWTSLPVPAILKPVPLWTGKQVFSVLLSRRINVKRKIRDPKDGKDFFDRDERLVRISRGELLAGALCKQAIGGAQGSLVSVIYYDVSPTAALNFVSDVQRLAHAFMLKKGLSFGVKDVLLGSESTERVAAVMDKFVNHVDNRLQPLADKKMAAAGDVEVSILRLGNSALATVGGIVQSSTSVDTNALSVTSTSASKGSKLNMTQIMGTLGQQMINGQRIQTDTYSNRTLPSYARNENGVQSRGFVCENFRVGLSPQSAYFHAMAGRESLSDTSVKTAEIGYMQRRLMKALESLTIRYDFTVRNADGAIVEFAYGGDGRDCTRGEMIHVKELTMSESDIKTRLQIDSTMMFKPDFQSLSVTSDENNDGSHVMERFHQDYMTKYAPFFKTELSRLLSLRRKVCDGKLGVIGVSKFDSTLYTAINAWRFIRRWKPESGKATPLSMRVTPQQVVESVGALCDKIERVLGTRATSTTTLFVICCQFTCKNVIEKFGYDIDSLNEVCQAMYMYYVKSLADPGDSIGAIAAESVGEPATQMTFNTFHFAGVVDKNVTLGMPRLLELVDATKEMKKPAMTVFLKPPINSSKAAVTALKDSLQYTVLGELVKETTLIGADDLLNPETISIEEQFCVTSAYNLAGQLPTSATCFVSSYSCSAEDIRERSWSFYTARLQLNRAGLVERGLEPSDVLQLLTDFVNGANCNAPIVASDNLDVNDLHTLAYNGNSGEHRPAVKNSKKQKKSTGNTCRSSKPKNDSYQDTTKVTSSDVDDGMCVELSSQEGFENGIRGEASSTLISAHHKAFVFASGASQEDWYLYVRFIDVPEMARIYATQRCGTSETGSTVLSANVLSTPNLEEEKVIVKRFCREVLDNCYVSGLYGIKVATPAEWSAHRINEVTNKIEKYSEHVIYTDGSDLLSALALPLVDTTRSTSNNIHEINNIFGIDAASDVLLQEMKQVLAFDGTYVQDRHVQLCVHTMSWYGYFVPMNRHGMEQMEKGFLHQASFEETYEVINDADAFGLSDNMSGVTANIIMGQTASFGTCSFSVIPTGDIGTQIRNGREKSRGELTKRREEQRKKTAFKANYSEERFKQPAPAIPNSHQSYPAQKRNTIIESSHTSEMMRLSVSRNHGEYSRDKNRVGNRRIANSSGRPPSSKPVPKVVEGPKLGVLSLDDITQLINSNISEDRIEEVTQDPVNQNEVYNPEYPTDDGLNKRFEHHYQANTTTKKMADEEYDPDHPAGRKMPNTCTTSNAAIFTFNAETEAMIDKMLTDAKQKSRHRNASSPDKSTTSSFRPSSP